MYKRLICLFRYHCKDSSNFCWGNLWRRKSCCV